MEDSQEAASEAEEAAVGRPLHITYLVTRSRSDSHVADTKFDSDDKSSLLIKCDELIRSPDRLYEASEGCS